ASLLVIRASMGMISTPLHPASATAVSLNLPAAARSSANGWITGAALVGIALTYPVFGWLIDRLDWPGAFLVMALVTAGLGALWLVYGPRHSHAAMDEPARSVSSDIPQDQRSLVAR